MNKRPETKIIAAAGGGTVVTGLVLWLLGVFVWHVPTDAAHAEAAVKAVPTYVSAAVVAATTFVLGYLAPRTSDAERGIDPAAPVVADDQEPVVAG